MSRGKRIRFSDLVSIAGGDKEVRGSTGEVPPESCRVFLLPEPQFDL